MKSKFSALLTKKIAMASVVSTVLLVPFLMSSAQAKKLRGKLENTPFTLSLSAAHSSPGTGDSTNFSVRLRNTSNVDQKFVADQELQGCLLTFWSVDDPSKALAPLAAKKGGTPAGTAVREELLYALTPKESFSMGKGTAKLQGETYSIEWLGSEVYKLPPGRYKVACVWTSQISQFIPNGESRAIKIPSLWLGQQTSNMIDLILPAKGAVRELDAAEDYRELMELPTTTALKSQDLVVLSESPENIANGHAFQSAFRIINYGVKPAEVVLQGHKVSAGPGATPNVFVEALHGRPASGDTVWAKFVIPSYGSVRLRYGFRYVTSASQVNQTRSWRLNLNGAEIVKLESDTFVATKKQ